MVAPRYMSALQTTTSKNHWEPSTHRNWRSPKSISRRFISWVWQIISFGNTQFLQVWHAHHLSSSVIIIIYPSLLSSIVSIYHPYSCTNRTLPFGFGPMTSMDKDGGTLEAGLAPDPVSGGSPQHVHGIESQDHAQFIYVNLINVYHRYIYIYSIEKCWDVSKFLLISFHIIVTITFRNLYLIPCVSRRSSEALEQCGISDGTESGWSSPRDLSSSQLGALEVTMRAWWVNKKHKLGYNWYNIP